MSTPLLITPEQVATLQEKAEHYPDATRVPGCHYSVSVDPVLLRAILADHASLIQRGAAMEAEIARLSTPDTFFIPDHEYATTAADIETFAEDVADEPDGVLEVFAGHNLPNHFLADVVSPDGSRRIAAFATSEEAYAAKAAALSVSKEGASNG